MEIKVTGTVFVELGAQTLALLSGGVLANQTTAKPSKEAVAIFGEEKATEYANVLDKLENEEKPAKEEKPKATRSRTAKKEEPTVQVPPKETVDEKPAEEEKPKGQAKEDDGEGGAITIEDIRKVQRKVSLAGGIEKMKDLLATFGVESASELKEKDYDAYYEKLVELV